MTIVSQKLETLPGKEQWSRTAGLDYLRVPKCVLFPQFFLTNQKQMDSILRNSEALELACIHGQ